VHLPLRPRRSSGNRSPVMGLRSMACTIAALDSLVAHQFAATAGEDRRAAGQARQVLLVFWNAALGRLFYFGNFGAANAKKGTCMGDRDYADGSQDDKTEILA